MVLPLHYKLPEWDEGDEKKKNENAPPVLKQRGCLGTLFSLITFKRAVVVGLLFSVSDAQSPPGIQEQKRSQTAVSAVQSNSQSPQYFRVEAPGVAEAVRQWFMNRNVFNVSEENMQAFKMMIPWESFRVLDFYDSDAGSEGLPAELAPPSMKVRVIITGKKDHPENTTTWYLCADGEVYKAP